MWVMNRLRKIPHVYVTATQPGTGSFHWIGGRWTDSFHRFVARAVFVAGSLNLPTLVEASVVARCETHM